MRSSFKQGWIVLGNAFVWSLGAYSAHFVLFVMIAIVGTIPSLILEISRALHLEAGAGFGIALKMISSLASIVVYMSMIRVVANIQDGAENVFPVILREVLRKFPGFLGVFLSFIFILVLSAQLISFIVITVSAEASFLRGVVVPAFFLAAFLGLIYVVTIFGFFLPALMIENAGAVGSIKRSVSVARKFFWWVLGSLLISMSGITLISTLVLVGLKFIGAGGVVSAIISWVIGVLFMPLASAFIVRLFTLLKDAASVADIPVCENNAPTT